ncbi:isoprenylcysteine carboxylmethyltransferase family protein [Afifella sp. H1R]|uniref:Protein-S-isoprenylcysteine O-methyltransferase Ste14 n=1 Tax=Consotaella salsifontis TaxID=1365950 RepID=A0A1T4TDC2_9HYPH|nr:isoprenylcysteine carboxylmethyltransferase family protein [Consotaella salsifontis]MCF1505999.1 isoprenylcysteine carboxylmethyltransferase family protein [Afifella sp. H1R]SKA38341.1 Protein-S-isoprenylcysteine O-methyltransferase Ste14 [Consotaella salsifontis]
MNAAEQKDQKNIIDLDSVQRRRKVALRIAVILVLGILPIMQSTWPVERTTHETVEIISLILISIAVLGRVWCTLYIGGRKVQEIVDTGPYSISRNPLYMFNFLGAVGVGAQTGSMLAGPLFALATFLIFFPVILSEEKALLRKFGEAFETYRQRVPRFGPSLRGWRDMEAVLIRPPLLWRTLRDGLVFFLVVPAFELIDWLQVLGFVTPLFHLP